MAGWLEVAEKLTKALALLEDAETMIEDLGAPHISENLTPTVEAVERFKGLALEKAEA
jgi:hypothetical protein